jgi:murein DD-endopeptidase MepM/ murein hydrolase activator NlpD
VSSRKERDRYIGRRRVPTPPRSRYAAVATTALIGAGVVGFAAASLTPDMKTTSGTALANISSNFQANRNAQADKVARDTGRIDDKGAKTESDVWMLPMGSYNVGTPYGDRTGSMQRGIELDAPIGTPFYAAHGGKVTLARWSGGYGYTVIVDIGNGVELVYGHASTLLVKEGDTVQPGDLLALTGNSGFSYTPHLHFEIRVNGASVDPSPYLLSRGVDLVQHTDVMN